MTTRVNGTKWIRITHKPSREETEGAKTQHLSTEVY